MHNNGFHGDGETHEPCSGPGPRRGSSRCSALFAILAVASVLGLLPARALGQKDDHESEALTLYQKAVALAKDGSWDEALEHFLAASDLGAPAVVHYNIGRCLEALERFEEAAASYERYLQDPSATDVDEVKGKINELRQKPSLVTIDSEPAGAAVLKHTDEGDVAVGNTPYKTELDAGMHAFILRLPGYEDKIVDVSSGYGSHIQIDSPLEKSAVPVEPPQEKGGAKPVVRSAIGLVVEAGGGLTLHMYRNVATAAGGSFLLDIHKILGHGRLHFAVGAQVSGQPYAMAAAGGGKYSTMFTDALAFAHLRCRLMNRLVLVAALPLGFSFLSALETIPEEAELKLLGGRLAGGSLPFFSVGISAAVRVDIFRGLHVLLRPLDLMLLVPLKTLYSENKVLPRYSLTVLLGWEF